ncbi:MAG: iron-containing alcohol dehydrogenase [Deltaproteobacteria bacterium]|nr:iron-containing alcohol dehydrogenase [Deltaproteobacteria bacterium]
MSPSAGTFSFATATRIHAGRGAIDKLPKEANRLGTRALLVTGKTPERLESLFAQLPIPFEKFSIIGEPDVNRVAKGATFAVAKGCDVVIALGGGSVIDAGKAISALITNRENVMTYLEVIGEGKPLVATPAPFIAVATTAGTGAEVTRNAVLFSPTHRVKVSMRSEMMLPDVAIVDPELTLSVPADITAATGLDALTQVIEPFVSRKANPLTDAICEAGMTRIARSLKRSFDNGADLDAREDMAIGSLFGGLALANAGLGAVHGFAGPMGGMFPIPHGVVCGRLLPFVFRANAHAVANIPHLQEKFSHVSRCLTGNPKSTVCDGIRWLDDLCAHLKVEGLAHFGVQSGDFDAIVTAAQRASSMKGNPVSLPDDVLKTILEQAM